MGAQAHVHHWSTRSWGEDEDWGEVVAGVDVGGSNDVLLFGSGPWPRRTDVALPYGIQKVIYTCKRL